MKNMKDQVISIIIIISLVSTIFAATAANSGNTATAQTDKLFITNTQGRAINPGVLQKSINLYQNLSEDKKVEIKTKMVKMTQERQKAIDAIEKQIKEFRLQRKLQKSKNQDAQISQLQAIKQLALKENATETVKSLESLINKYVNNNSIDDNNIKVE